MVTMQVNWMLLDIYIYIYCSQISLLLQVNWMLIWYSYNYIMSNQSPSPVEDHTL